jgi:hypothetical protein
MNPHKAGSDFRQLRRHFFFRTATLFLASPVNAPEPLSGFPHTVFLPLGTASQEAGKKGDWSSKVTELISFPLLCKQLCEGHPDSAIKEELAEKGMAKVVSYSAKLRLKLPLWENSPAIAN